MWGGKILRKNLCQRVAKGVSLEVVALSILDSRNNETNRKNFNIARGANLMTTCDHAETCIFFNELMAGMPSTVGAYKQRYCQGSFQGCARYTAREALGVDSVPLNLFPHQLERMATILSVNRRD